MISEISIGFTPWSSARQVIPQHDRLISPDQGGEREEAAITTRKAGTIPHVTEQAILGVFVECRGNHLNILAGDALVRRSDGGNREHESQSE
jgi:hypothetical protein